MFMKLPKRFIAAFLILAIVLSMALVAIPHSPGPRDPPGRAFDNVVIIAMENRDVNDVFNNANAPFITSLLSTGAYTSNYQGYGASGRTVSGCSAGCYTALISGSDQGISNGYSCCINAPTVIDRLQAAGFTWQAFCESGCPRGNDHFPFTGFAGIASSPNIHTESTVSPSDFIAAASSASPPNFLWFTPTDGHNMHNNSVQTGDAYIQDFLVGTGTLGSPAPGSLFATALLKSSRTLFMLWWDEFSNPPELFHGPVVHQGLVSSSFYDHYSTLRMIEDNWSLSTLTANDAAATGMFGEFLIPSTGTNWPSCGPPVKITLSQLETGTGLNLNPDKRSLTPPCNSLYELDGMILNANSFSGECGVIVTGFCDFHLPFNCSVAAGCLFEIDQTWLASGVTYPSNCSAPVGGVCITQGTNVSATGFFFIDSHGKHEFHPTASIVINTAPPPPPPPPLPPPVSGFLDPSFIKGWGGTYLSDQEILQNPSNPASVVFLGEKASNLELLVKDKIAPRVLPGTVGGIRLSFDVDNVANPTCSPDNRFSTVTDHSYEYSKAKLDRALAIAKFFSIWAVVDRHGNTDMLSTFRACWLSVWGGIVASYANDSANIVWEPLNEPCGSCDGRTETLDLAQMSSAYQSFVTQARGLGDTHWIVLQNICSFSCSPGVTFSTGYPISVTDPLNRILLSIHPYMDWGVFFNSWTNAQAEQVALDFFDAMKIAQLSRPILNTEGGADWLSDTPLPGPPDIRPLGTTVRTSAGWTLVTLHFVLYLQTLEDNNSMAYMWWPAGDWTNTPGSGIYGALAPTLYGDLIKCHLPDINGDGMVSIIDVATVAFHFNTDSTMPGWLQLVDLNGDRRITIVDVAIVASDFDMIC